MDASDDDVIPSAHRLRDYIFLFVSRFCLPLLFYLPAAAEERGIDEHHSAGFASPSMPLPAVLWFICRGELRRPTGSFFWLASSGRVPPRANGGLQLIPLGG